MPEIYDVSLGAKGYMVAAKSYKRTFDAAGVLGAAPLRQVQRDFSGGSLRPLQAEQDRFHLSVGLLPAEDQRGLTAGAKEAGITVAGLHASAKRLWVIVGGRPYMASGGKLYSVDRAGLGVNPNNLGTLTQLGATLGTDINALTTDGATKIYAATGGAYRVWTIGGGAWDTTPTLGLFWGLAWAGGFLWGGYLAATGWTIAKATSNATIDGAGYPIDSAPRSMLGARDGIYTGTGGGLWRTRVTTSGVSGLTQSVTHDQIIRSDGSGRVDDYTYLAEYNGQIYTWVNGQVMRYHNGTASGEQLVATGLRGYQCTGLASAGGYLIAAIVTDNPTFAGANNQLWAYNGKGWFCLRVNDDGLHYFNGVIPTAGYIEDGQVLTTDGTLVYGYQLRALSYQPGLSATGRIITSLWQGRDPDKDKSFTRVGCEMQWQDRASFASCTASLYYSTDGGNTWTLAATNAAVANNGPLTLAADLPAGTVARTLALKWTLSGVTTGAPVLAALWCESRLVEPIVGKRHWEFVVEASDGLVLRSGKAEPRKGQVIAADLWGQFDARAALTLKDLDYDLTATTRTVRIVGLEEAHDTPADGGRWNNSRIKVRLVEV